MSEQIILAILSGLIIPILLEMWKKHYLSSQETYRQNTIENPLIYNTIFLFLKFLGILIFAFFVSAIFSVIIENNGHPNIEFGSAIVNFMMFSFGLIAWFILFLLKK
jgi:hypothetical protein